MTFIKTWLAVLGLWALTGAAQAAPTYICVGLCTGIVVTDPTVPIPPKGQLVNILGVTVDGSSYDVAFVDGRFSDIFGTSSPSLAFTSQTAAENAALALSNVLVDVGSGGPTSVQAFDSDPSLTRGCSLDQGCLIMTPFEVPSFLGGAAFRHEGFVNDNPFLDQVADDGFVGFGTGLLDLVGEDSSLNAGRTFAVWRVAGGTGPDDPLNRFFAPPTYGASPPIGVPEPGTVLLMVIALLGLVASRGMARARIASRTTRSARVGDR